MPLQQQAPLPKPSQFIVFDDFSGGMNTQSARIGLPEKYAAWMENLQPIAPNYLLGVQSPVAALATLTGETIVKFFQTLLGIQDYIIAFCASGSGYAITVAGGVGVPATGGIVTKFAPAGTFSATGPDMTTFTNTRILIADSKAGYSTWDGTLFVQQGGVSPNFAITNGGSNYSSGVTGTISEGVAATGNITFTVNPTASDTITLNGVTWTFVSSPASDSTVIQGTLAETLTQLVSDLTGSGNATITAAVYSATATVLNVTYGMGGTGGNSFTIAASAATPSGTNLTGGTASGSGTGATISVQTVGGVVTGITLLTTGTGYTASDVLTVTINDTTGSGAVINGHVWPFVSPNPTTIAVAFGRVWLAAARTLIVTGTGSSTYGAGYDDFQSADASVTTVLSDTDLIHQITTLRFLENYLYIIGDNSVKSIGSISVTSGVTNFTITTISSDQGTIWPQTVISYNRLVLFANASGVFAVFGASVEKISPPMDGIFFNINFNILPSAAVNDLNQIHTYLLLVNYNDPQLGARGLILAFSNKRWHVINQGYGLATICTVFLGGHADTFGSSGADVTQLLQGTTAPVPYKLQTSQTAHQNPVKDKRSVRIGVAQTVPATSDLMLTVDTENGTVNSNLPNASAILTIQNNAGQTMTFVNNSGQVMSFAAKGFVAQHQNVNNTGRWMGSTATGTLNGIAIQGIYIEYQDGSLWGKG
jgi:hypothetical protein